jgi:hypothetical protein
VIACDRVYIVLVWEEAKEAEERRERYQKRRIYAGFGTVPMAYDMASVVWRRFKQQFYGAPTAHS